MSFGRWVTQGRMVFDINSFLDRGRNSVSYTPTFFESDFVYFKSGSQVICNPPPEDSDHDYFIYLNRDLVDDEDAYLTRLGLEKAIGDDYEATSGFVSWRSGKYNIIVLENYEEYIGCNTATHICKMLNIQDKASRVEVFESLKRAAADVYDYTHYVARQREAESRVAYTSQQSAPIEFVLDTEPRW